MTREEAINEIKSWAIPSRNGREVLETLIPELRENEDESLKNKSGYYKAGKFWKASTLWNATKNKIPQRVPNRYILQECTWNIGTLQRFADEVKNVQEVSLDYPIILDMNGNIIDGAHRVVKAYLEGKDIDIVYIGDDEWPEPDYDEEKAVKESDDERVRKSLIKFLTDIKEISESGRTSWAVRKEDAEMCKSFLAWLEKQKEKLGDISTILLVKKEIERRIETWQKSRKELIAMECNTLADDAAVRIEELYSLISFLGTIRCNTNEKQKEQKDYRKLYEDIAQSEWFKKAYAGKSLGEEFEQKEQNGEDGFLEDELSAFLQNYDKEYDDDAAVSDVARHFYEIGKKQKEQKQAQTSEEKEYVRTIKSIISDFIRDKKPENLAYYQRIYDWLDGRHVPFSCGHENGKSTEWAELQSEFKNINEAFEDGKKEVIDHPDKYGLTKQKPVERSLEDDHIIGFVYDLLNEIEWKDNWAMSKEECLRLLSNYSPQKPTGATINGEPIPTENHSVNIPLAEWSEEDEEMMADIIDSLEYAYPYDNEFRIAWLKSLRPQPQWKPSEEQMAMLLAVINDPNNAGAESCHIALMSLYNDLKKLM